MDYLRLLVFLLNFYKIEMENRNLLLDKQFKSKGIRFKNFR